MHNMAGSAEDLMVPRKTSPRVGFSACPKDTNQPNPNEIIVMMIVIQIRSEVKSIRP